MAASALVELELSGSQPVSEATGHGPGAVSHRRAVVVDQARLHDGVAHAGVVALRQHMVVAQQILSPAAVLDQRAQRAAAAVHNLLPRVS